MRVVFPGKLTRGGETAFVKGGNVGTRTLGIVEYQVPDAVHCEPAQLLSLLSEATPACLAIEQYWRTHDQLHEPDLAAGWSIVERGENELSGWKFDGPGGMSIRFGSRVAEILAGARWRGFLTIPALREVYVAAFVGIALVVAAPAILFVPDYAYDDLAEMVEGGASFEQCRQLLAATWGPCQNSLDAISPEVVADCENCPPQVWYQERL